MTTLSSLNGDIYKEAPDCFLQCSDLFRIVWTDNKGENHFPYLPFTTEKYWEDEISRQWINKEMISWVRVSDVGQIFAHVAIIKVGNHYELGRWAAYHGSPRGAVTDLCKEALKFADSVGKKVFVAATQAHTTSQYICREGLGLRFAGIGFAVNNGKGGFPWDIIYYDNLDIVDFVSQKGITGNSLGKPIPVLSKHLPRLIEAVEILSDERGGCLPPLKFHIWTPQLEVVRDIFLDNIEYLSKK